MRIITIVFLLLFSIETSASSSGSQLPLVKKIQGALGAGIKKVATGTFVITMCANLLSCDLQRTKPLLDLATPDETAGDLAPAETAEGLAIMQGVTTENQTQIFVLNETDSDYIFSLHGDEGQEILPATVNSHQYSDHIIRKLLFQGLAPNTTYLFQAHSASTEELVDARELQTISFGRQDLRFAFTSCMLDYYNQGDIWEQMVNLNPDVIFLIGDNVYADTLTDMATPADLWIRNIETRNTVNLFRSKKLIPVVATWDDHDYGMNNAGKDYPYKEEALVVFKAFFASDQSENFSMPEIGVASHFNIYGYDFFLLDDRTFRTARGTSPQWHFGARQSQWLWDNLPGKGHAFIVSGDQFFGGYTPLKDSFQGHHPQRFTDFLGKLQESGTKVAFLSGDRHYTEIMEIPTATLGYQTYEFTASPAHAFIKSFPVFPNPLRIAGSDLVTNFMLIEADKSGEKLSLRATSYTVGGRVLFSGEYTVD